MSSRPQMAFGIPVYNHAHQLERTLESILAQSFDKFGVVLVDDCSSDDSIKILERYAQSDTRLHIVRNERRLGYTRNALKAYQLCRQVFPSIEFFAWGSDHDVWHPHWLRILVDQLRAEPQASLAWSWNHTLTKEGDIVRSRTDLIERGTIADRRERIIFAAKEAPAGSFLHGLIRVAALEKTSGLRMVLAPDRLLVAELAAMGPFTLVPEFLWLRRYFGLASRSRQRRNSFPEGAPLYTYTPITLQHAWVLFSHFAVRRGVPELSFRDGCSIVRDFVKARRDFRHEQRLRAEEARENERRRRLKQREKEKRSRRRRNQRTIGSLSLKLHQVASKILPRRPRPD